MKTIVILGAPGSGKGTVAARLAKRLPLRHVSTGDLLRAAARDAATPAARAVAETMRKGELVGDEVVGALVVEQFDAPSRGCEYLLLDGYPRNEKQAGFLEAELGKRGGRVDRAIWLEVPGDVLVARLSGRRTCPRCSAGYHVVNLPPKKEGVCDACGAKLVQRPDDMPANVENRLRVYAASTAPLLGWYERRGVLERVAGDAAPYEVADAVARAIAGGGKARGPGGEGVF